MPILLFSDGYDLVLSVLEMLEMPTIMDCGLGNYLFGKVSGSKMCKGKSWRVVLALQAGMMALCFIVNPFLILILSFSLFNNLYETAGYTKIDLFPAFMHMGMMLNCSVVTMKVPWTGMALIPMGAIQQMLFKINVYGVNFLIVALLAVIPVDGEPLLNISSAAKQFPWDLLILFASAVCVGGALVSADGGISAFLSTKMAPFLMKFGGIGFFLAVAVVMMILTNLLNNTAVMVAVSSMVASMFLNGLIDETTMYAACMLVAVVGDIGVLHPGSSATSAIYFGQPIISAKTGYTVSITAVIYCLILVIAVLTPLSQIFY